MDPFLSVLSEGLRNGEVLRGRLGGFEICLSCRIKLSYFSTETEDPITDVLLSKLLSLTRNRKTIISYYLV